MIFVRFFSGKVYNCALSNAVRLLISFSVHSISFVEMQAHSTIEEQKCKGRKNVIIF